MLWGLSGGGNGASDRMEQSPVPKRCESDNGHDLAFVVLGREVRKIGIERWTPRRRRRRFIVMTAIVDVRVEHAHGGAFGRF